jgi:hypothetical protein
VRDIRWKTWFGLAWLAIAVALCSAFPACNGFSLQGPEPKIAMDSILQAATKGDARYVVDEVDRGQVPSVAISRSAWNVLASHSSELVGATVAITTTGDQMDLVSSVIRIDSLTSRVLCYSDNGQVAAPHYFYVYTCTLVTDLH